MEIEPKIDKVVINGNTIYVLRDDLLGEFNGNKARKLEYFLKSDLSNFNSIVSFGSSQSNAMYSLSVFAKKKNLKFNYVMSHLSSNLKLNPAGNFKFALENGMRYFISENRYEFAKSICDAKSIFIEEGVAQIEAESGFKTQANFIKSYTQKNEIDFDIFLPSGTGASAAYLAKHIEMNVYTTPCVGDCKYLKRQILHLDENSKVKIIPPPRKFHFGKPYLKLYEIWRNVCEQSKIEFELIYDPVGFATLFSNLSCFKNPILYIHQGGTLANVSQLERYKYKFKI